jgi:hypothetical protein
MSFLAMIISKWEKFDSNCAFRELVLDAFVAKVLVEVLLVIVALVPRRLVNSAEVAERTDAKKLVLVAAVVVEFVTVRRLN